MLFLRKKIGALLHQKKPDWMQDAQQSRLPLRGTFLWYISPGCFPHSLNLNLFLCPGPSARTHMHPDILESPLPLKTNLDVPVVLAMALFSLGWERC